MAAKAVQISLDEELLKRIDRDPETRQRGRSAFIRAAVELYFEEQRRRRLDDEIARAYEGQADALHEEVAELMEDQQWPTE